MFLLTGLAGTGKTTVLKAIVDGFKSLIEKNMKEGTKIHDIQVISPQRYDKIGANELNYFIGDAFNKYEGRKVYKYAVLDSIIPRSLIYRMFIANLNMLTAIFFKISSGGFSFSSETLNDI